MESENLTGSSGFRRNYILFTFAVFATFAILGVADNLRGTALPRIQDEFSLTELHLGLLLALNATGYVTACSFTAALARKIGMKTCFYVGLVVVAASGVCICYSPSYAILVVGFFILNLGFGILEISLGVIAATIFTKRTGTMMNLAHFFYGAGATLSPVISTGLIAMRFGDRVFGWRYAYLIILCFALIPVIPAAIARVKVSGSSERKTGYANLLKKPVLWLLTPIIALGLVGELGSAAWLVNFLETAYSYSSERAALYLTLYFTCFTAGRLLLGPLIDKVGFINCVAIFMAFAGTAIAVGVLIGEAATPLLFLAGFGIGPLFPTVMAIIAKLFADEVDLAMTAVLTTLGIILVPANFMIGGIINGARLILVESHGDAGVGMAYSVGYLFLGLCCFGAFTFALLLRARQKKAGRLV